MARGTLHVKSIPRYELQRRLSVIFLGRAHSSSAVHEKVVHNLERRGPDCPELDTLRAAAVRARDAVAAGDDGAGGDGGSITLLGSSERAARQAMLRAILEENPALVPIPFVLSRQG
jgi:D-glycero-alpha-D-manno-heptose-7-phosphate kinase